MLVLYWAPFTETLSSDTESPNVDSWRRLQILTNSFSHGVRCTSLSSPTTYTLHTAWCKSICCFFSNSSSYTFLTLQNLEPVAILPMRIEKDVALEFFRHICCNFKSTLLFSKVYKEANTILTHDKAHFFCMWTHTLSFFGLYVGIYCNFIVFWRHTQFHGR